MDYKGEIISVTSGKGGVGKSTTTANLGAGLALLGKKIVLVDLDIGLKNLDMILGLENRIVYNIIDILEGNCNIYQSLIKSRESDNLYLLPASQINDKNDVTPDDIIYICSELRKDFDYIILDSPAGIEQGFKNATTGIDKCLIITTPSLSAIRDADRVIGLLNADGFYNFGLIINKINPKMVAKGNMIGIEEIAELLNIELIGTIPEDEEVVISTNKGKALVFESYNIFSKPHYKNLAKRIIGEEIPFQSLERNIFNKFYNLICN